MPSIDDAVDRVIHHNPKEVTKLINGDMEMIKYLIGRVMIMTRAQGIAPEVMWLMRTKLGV